MANGDIHKLGTLYVNNIKKPFPTKPWGNGITPTGAPSAGNILNYDSVNGNIEIKNTDSDDAYKLRWVEVNNGDKKLLISDRCLLAKITWDELNAQGLVNGKEITIDGQMCKIRLLSGGTSYRSGSNNYSGGTPTTNEWDRIITNESSFDVLPKPTSTDLDSSPNATNFNGAHNQIWNWHSMYSWCQEVYSRDLSCRVVRGYTSARYFNNVSSGIRGYDLGWRPVLEVLNSAPEISINDEDLGDQLNSISKTYNIIDENGDTFTLTEKLNGTPIRILENQVSGTEYTLDLTQQWDSISYGNHAIEIIATDSNGLSSTVTITFNKIKEITKPIPTTSSLKAFIDHVGNADKDIDYLRYKLSDNLNSKGVECSSQDKVSILIDKVKNISMPITTAGESITLQYNKTGISHKLGSVWTDYDCFTILTSGIATFKFTANNPNGAVYTKFKIIDKLGNLKYESLEFNNTSGTAIGTVKVDISTSIGDKIIFSCKAFSTSQILNITEIYLTCGGLTI